MFIINSSFETNILQTFSLTATLKLVLWLTLKQCGVRIFGDSKSCFTNLNAWREIIVDPLVVDFDEVATICSIKLIVGSFPSGFYTTALHEVQVNISKVQLLSKTDNIV